MGYVKFKKGSGEWNLFQDYWQLCQKFWEPEADAAYWEQAAKETEEFYQKYKNINAAFAKEISLAFLRSLEARNEEN